MTEIRCRNCQAPLVRRPDERLCKFKLRKSCSDACRRRLLGSTRIHADPSALRKQCPTCREMFGPRPRADGTLDVSGWTRQTACSMRCGAAGRVQKNPTVERKPAALPAPKAAPAVPVFEDDPRANRDAYRAPLHGRTTYVPSQSSLGFAG